jgi:hypothetical protein
MYNYLVLVLLNLFNKNVVSEHKIIDYPNIHLQNLKDELSILKNGYWVKIADNTNIINNKDICNIKSKYPEIIVQEKNIPPKFNYENIKIEKINSPNNEINAYSIIDYEYRITYLHTDYIVDTNIVTRFDIIKYNNNKNKLKYKLIKTQLESKIRSLEAMIYLFEKTMK